MRDSAQPRWDLVTSDMIAPLSLLQGLLEEFGHDQVISHLGWLIHA
jgi:hypothetical protein